MVENSQRLSQSRHDLLNLWGKRILVVEDDPVVAVDYRFQLEGAGALQALAPSTHRAMAYLALHEIDAAIIDYHLLDGACTPVLELLAVRHIPYVVVSGDTFGIDDIPPEAPLFSKPISAQEVCQALSRALQ
jgi:CheY-like chemotaxis protein